MNECSWFMKLFGLENGPVKLRLGLTHSWLKLQHASWKIYKTRRGLSMRHPK